jgi:hypothetical protein
VKRQREECTQCERERERIRLGLGFGAFESPSVVDRQTGLHGQTKGEREREREMIGLGLAFEAFELKV